MVTTAGLTRSTRSAKLKGVPVEGRTRGLAGRGVAWASIIGASAATGCRPFILGSTPKALNPTTSTVAAVPMARTWR